MESTDMGADAVRSALGDAGVEWRDVQFAFGGSFEVDNPDAVTSRLGLGAMDACVGRQLPITRASAGV